jgi:hypothetical protein
MFKYEETTMLFFKRKASPRFRLAFIQAVHQAKREARLKPWEFEKLRSTAWKDEIFADIEDQCSEDCILLGYAKDRNSINWEKLLSLLIEWLPIILKFLSKE